MGKLITVLKLFSRAEPVDNLFKRMLVIGAEERNGLISTENSRFNQLVFV